MNKGLFKKSIGFSHSHIRKFFYGVVPNYRSYSVFLIILPYTSADLLEF